MAGMKTHSKRKQNKVDYKQLSDTKFPRAKRVRRQKPDDICDEVFPIEILQREDQRVQVHYIGYDTKYDEWKDEAEIECLTDNEAEAEDSPVFLEMDSQSVGTCYKPLSLYDILRVRVKQTLTCSRKDSPSIKISMPFDILLYNGGLKAADVLSGISAGIQHYKLKNYADLNHLLGRNWHFRGLNANGDYGYAVLDTIDFYIRKCRALTEYMPSQLKGGDIVLAKTDSLVFSFVCGYGTPDTFGKDKKFFNDTALNIFVQYITLNKMFVYTGSYILNSSTYIK